MDLPSPLGVAKRPIRYRPLSQFLNLQTALFFAAQNGRISVVRFLLDHGAKVDAMGDGGRAVLDAAKDNAQISVMLRAAMR